MGFNYRLILLLLISSSAMGQSLAPSGNYNTLSVFNGGTKSTRAMIAPKGFQPWATYDTTGFIWLDTVNHFLYYHNGTTRVQIGAGGGGSGTVTNVSTGFGMLGGPITTTGTVRVDSNVMMTLARGYKVADSVAGLIPSVSGYQLYTDTNTFDATKANLNAGLAGKQNYTDTSTFDATRSWVTTNYVPYNGAIDSVRLGEYPIRAGQFRFDLTPTMPTVVGGMYWDTGNVTVSLPLNADVNLQIGQESLVRARNNTGSTVTNGQVVYISGAQGNNPAIGLADADSAATSQVIGVATEDIADNGTGFVTVSGVVNDVNTSSWAAGDKLYLSTTNGQLTNTPPTPPHISVMVGTALNSTNNGRIFVSPSQPIATDTLLNNGQNLAPTQYAVRRYVLNRLADTAAAIRAAIPSVAGYATTSALADSVSGRVKYSDTVSLIGTQYQIDTAAFNALTRINTKGSGTVTSVGVVAGTGVSIGGTSPITTSGTYTVTNTAPDQTVSLTGAGTVSVTGTYPTFTVTGTGGSGGVASITSTGSTIQVTGTTTVNVEVDTTHSFTFTANNTFTRDITVDSASIGTGNGLSTNIRFGRNALPSATTASGDVALGENTLNKITTGISNVAIGRNAMANTSVSVNGIVAIGVSACNYSTGDNNVAIGNGAMGRSVAWNGIANSGIGANSGNALTSGSSNSWLGAGAGNALTSGSSNTLLGVNSGNAITTGGSNVILGSFTGNSGGLDIRTVSNRLVLADGAGNIRAYHNNTNWLIGTVTDGSTGILQLSGSLGLNTAGNKLNIATGANASVGTGTLSGGTATINTTAVTASSIIQVQLTSCSSCGTLYISAQLAGTSFTVTSTNGSDASTFNYWIIN